MWRKERPTKEGWYFWRKTKAQHDPWKYHAYYITEGEEGEEGECWENGTEVHWPIGGSWKANDTFFG